MKTSIFFTIVFAGIIAAGCNTTTYLSLTENNKEQIEQKLNEYEQDENKAAEVTLLLKDRTEINGELLSVRDSTMIICTEYLATEEGLSKLIYPITAVRNDEIWDLTIEGSSYVWIGTGVGMLVGTGIGYAISTSVHNYGKYLPLPILFIVGASFGYLIGDAVSTYDIILHDIPHSYDFSLLKPLARYSDEEPEYLRAIK